MYCATLVSPKKDHTSQLFPELLGAAMVKLGGYIANTHADATDCPASKGEDIVSDASIGLLAQNVVAQTAPQSFAENYWVRLRRGSEGQNTQNILTP
ncbi:hypothetical protein MRS44_010126 [Fusarium solani]|uniref:uncharacterized protein n=1 Tax=Fusarium solani TaxID=169388 RepID=UPI0032C46F1F|nr:hypothetical protein MRS44_010126 [Fusarium solani]